MRAVTIDSDLATLFTFTPRKPPITREKPFKPGHPHPPKQLRPQFQPVS